MICTTRPQRSRRQIISQQGHEGREDKQFHNKPTNITKTDLTGLQMLYPNPGGVSFYFRVFLTLLKKAFVFAAFATLL
jgi:hypothetical protein